jgi:hypothetical protein
LSDDAGRERCEDKICDIGEYFCVCNKYSICMGDDRLLGGFDPMENFDYEALLLLLLCPTPVEMIWLMYNNDQSGVT